MQKKKKSSERKKEKFLLYFSNAAFIGGLFIWEEVGRVGDGIVGVVERLGAFLCS